MFLLKGVSYMEFVGFYGDNRLRHKIIYNRNSYSECVYCGGEADTREHVPSKVFLVKPYPDNLGIIPACLKCNNSYSKDELFLSILIEKLKSKHYGQKYSQSKEVETRIKSNEKIAFEIEQAIENNSINKFEKKISRIIFKLALGHSVYELSEGFKIQDGTINYSFLDSMSTRETEEFSLPFNISKEPLPEIGSRVYQRIMVLTLDLVAVNDPEQKMDAPIIFLDWVDVQQSKYNYTSYIFGNKIITKIIINDFMYTEISINIR
jgi:hypothetical protein